MNDSTVNESGTFVPADAPPGGVQPVPATQQNAPGYAQAVRQGTVDAPDLAPDPGVAQDDPVFGRFYVPAQQTDEAYDLGAARANIVHVYDHDGDGYPEYADVRMPDGSLAQHVELPEALRTQPNATAAAVPLLNPATCAATGMVVERHELVNGVLPQLNTPGKAYGEQFWGKGQQDTGLSNPNAGATARDMSSADRVHDRFTNLESAVFGGQTLPAQPSAASADAFAPAIDAQTTTPPVPDEPTTEAPAPEAPADEPPADDISGDQTPPQE